MERLERIFFAVNLFARPHTLASCDRPSDAAETLCRFKGAAATRVLSISVQDALRAYLRKHKTISPMVEGRVSAEDASGVVWSQYEVSKGGVKE